MNRDAAGGPRFDFVLWALAGVLTIAGVIVLAWPDGTSGSPSVPPTTTSPSGPHTVIITRGENGPPGEASLTTPSAASPAGLVAIEAFAAEFGRGHDNAWTRRVSSWVTPVLAQGLAKTAPERRPNGHVVAITPVAVGAYALEATVDYDTGLAVQIRAEFGEAGWLVTSVLPVNKAEHR